VETSKSLSFLLTTPLLAAALCWLIPKAVQRLFAVFASFLVLALTLYETSGVLFSGTLEMARSFFVDQRLEWVPELGISLGLRLDGVSAWFIVLAAVTGVVAFSLPGVWYRKHPRLFTSLGFFLLFALNAAFLSTDLLAFYLSYEAVFIPMIFMVGIWGENQKAASVFRFFLMSFAGSILMLVSMFSLVAMHHSATGVWSSHTADLMRTVTAADGAALILPAIGFFLAFAIKVPLVPFHGWLKEVYVNAPMPATIWMSAILSKLGVAGMIRFVLPLFAASAKENQSCLLAMAAISVVYPALLAIRAPSAKELLAYSSISHLGFVMLGVFTLKEDAISAAILLSVGHGLTSALLFFLLNQVEERAGEGLLSAWKGLANRFPVLFTALFVGVLASVSLPGTLNFGGEFLVLLQAYQVSALFTLVAGSGVVLGAVYMLKFYQRLGLGVGPETTGKNDLGWYELVLAAMLIAVLIYGGLRPAIFMKGL
jgi:NADH-quinone oxidoreductase subunit M